MSDAQGDAPDSAPQADPVRPAAEAAAATAGSLLRQARVAKGLHIAALATSIKVTPRKLELLEADRYDELPGATFTRALAQTVCRTLKIDAAPVLALLPQPADHGLSQMSMGLNAPFRDKPGRRVPSDLPFLKSPVLLGAGVLVVASLVLYLLPAGWIADITHGNAAKETETAPLPPGTTAVVDPTPLPPVASSASEAVATAASAVSVSASAASAVDSPASAPAAASAPTVSAAPMASTPPTGALLLQAKARSWVEVIDGQGNPLMSRLLDAGETVGLDGPTPLRVRIGNAAATQVSFRGRPVVLAPTRDNVAKLELR